jgi:hypothetical protein
LPVPDFQLLHRVIDAQLEENAEIYHEREETVW